MPMPTLPSVLMVAVVGMGSVQSRPAAVEMPDGGSWPDSAIAIGMSNRMIAKVVNLIVVSPTPRWSLVLCREFLMLFR